MILEAFHKLLNIMKPNIKAKFKRQLALGGSYTYYTHTIDKCLWLTTQGQNILRYLKRMKSLPFCFTPGQMLEANLLVSLIWGIWVIPWQLAVGKAKVLNHYFCSVFAKENFSNLPETVQDQTIMHWTYGDTGYYIGWTSYLNMKILIFLQLSSCRLPIQHSHTELQVTLILKWSVHLASYRLAPLQQIPCLQQRFWWLQCFFTTPTTTLTDVSKKAACCSYFIQFRCRCIQGFAESLQHTA